MKELIRYLRKQAAWLVVALGAILFGAAGITAGLAAPGVVNWLDASEKDAPLIVTETATPPVKSGYDYGGGIPSSTPTGLYEFTDHAPPKVSGLPTGPLYLGDCGPHLLELSLALGAMRGVSFHVPGQPSEAFGGLPVRGVDLVLRFLDDQSTLIARSVTPMMPSDELTAAEFEALVQLLASGEQSLTLPNAIVTGFDFGTGPLPSKISFSFVLHFPGAPDEELWLIERDGGDPVLVSFEAGDIHRPYLISVYACPPEPVATPTRAERESEDGPRDRRRGG